MAVNERQLKRLRGVLNPFMLRRVKADVASEMVAKHEATIFCEPSPRQQVPSSHPGVPYATIYRIWQKTSLLVLHSPSTEDRAFPWFLLESRSPSDA